MLEVLRKAKFAPQVLANKVEEGTKEGGFTREISVNGEKVTLTLVKA